MTDADGDGFSDNHEYRAGTDPLDPRSKLQFTSAVPSGHNGLVLEWEGVAGRVHRLNATTNLTVGFAPLISDILAVPGLMRVTNTLPANISQLYYRLEVQSP